MNFRGRTVALIVIVAMMISSLSTAVVVGQGGLFDQILQTVSFHATGDEFDQNSGKLKEAFSLIRGNYLRKVTDQQLMDGAIQGMVNALGDPYSTYMDPKTASQFKSFLSSSFVGIGAEVMMKDGHLTIVSPFKGSPAEKAGLRPGDQVLKANGESLDGLDINTAVSKIRGPKGSKVILDIARPGVKDLIHVTIIRAEIPLQTVQSQMLPGQIGRITISQFAEGTADDFDKALKSLEGQGMKGLVIDVRGNPGGLLPAVLQMSGEFVPNGKTIVMTEDKAGNRTKYPSKLEKTKPYPVVVLIDKGSASASEIMAGALHESAGYTLVGVTSFGKGTVQTTQDFGDGSNIKLTIAKWLTPDGNWIDQHGGSKGIKPDIVVQMPDYFTAIPPQPSHPLGLDQTSDDVKNMQIVLTALGFNPGRQDGYFSAQTATAVKEFQKVKNLPQTGQLDSASAQTLQDAFAALLQDPKNDTQLQAAIEVLKKKMQ